MMTVGVSGAWGQTTYTYYAFHNKDKGYFKQCKGAVYNDGTFRYANAYDGNGSSIWVLSSDGYLKQEMYYLNVANGKTLYLSTTPVTQWDVVADGDDNTKNRLQMRGSTKILGLNDNTPVIWEPSALTGDKKYKYAACTLTVTENNSKWEGPKEVTWTVQSPQLVTYLRTFYLRNITVKIVKNDAGTENAQVANGDSRCYCSLTYKSTSNTDKGTKWDINTTTGVIYNKTTGQLKDVKALYDLAPLDPIVLGVHGKAIDQEIKLTINVKAFTPADNKKYLLFSTLNENYRFPKATSSIAENALLPVDGKKADLSETINEEISWDVECDIEGYYSFKNIASGRYIYYDAADYTVSDYGAVKIGATSLPSDDTRYKFRIFNTADKDVFKNCRYIIPYDKQFAVYKSDGTIEEIFFALYTNTSNSTKIASIYKANNDAKWTFYTYEWQNRLWDNYNIVGDKDIYTAGEHVYTATTWRSRNIKGSPLNTDVCAQPGTKSKEGISYTWEVTGLDASYIATSSSTSNGTGTLTATITLPPGTRTGELKLTTNAPSYGSHTKTIPLTLYNLNPSFAEITSLSQIDDVNGLYKLTADITYDASTNKPAVTTFSGTLDGNGKSISGLTAPLFATLDGATVRNLTLDNVNITTGTNVGAVCGEATGNTRIYNCGILASNSALDDKGNVISCSSSVGGSNYVGGIVGLLDGSARVINCFSYANIIGGDYVGGIVGYNNVATTTNSSNSATYLKTMVMNCMFYGDIKGGSNKAPIYNGQIITNRGDQSGVGNYNYFYAEAPYVLTQDIQTPNCALMAEARFLQRFEFFRHLLNSHRELAAWWATGNYNNKDEMMKWVMEPSQIGTVTPYPILKTPGYYPSVVNIDAEHATTQTERNKGGKLGTLTVNIEMGDGAVYPHPTDAEITAPSLTLNITDKDPDHFNFNYYKVQLPYYNDVGTKNYTGNRVVTGWKIVSITGGTPGTYRAADEWGGYNFADRNCTNKDKYSESGRVFSQGAYWDVPEGVTAITIEPYWAKAAYLADANADKVYDQNMGTEYNVPNVGGGTIYTNGNSYLIAGNSQKVYTSLSNAVSSLSITGSPTVNDYAVVLVGNYHHVVSSGSAVSASSPYTVTSIDMDGDNEPDYSLMLRNNGRNVWHPVKWDFINIPGLGMAQKSTGGTGSYNFGIVVPKGWFETTNTSLFRVTQFEYERSGSHTISAPYILQGGVIEQWVTGQQDGNDTPKNITYFHVGGNVWFKEFHRGVHQDKTAYSNHPPVSVTGGDFEKFYLTGMYRADVTSYGDNAECYINGGRFGTIAGAAMEGIGNGTENTGNITWQIQNADIKEFYGGGLNADRPVRGNITTTVTGGKIDLFCGGPKFGDMDSGKTVTTTATGCEFGTFFGAGFGGSSYSRRAPRNIVSMENMPAKTGDNKSYNTWSDWVKAEYKQQTATNFPGISTQYSYQFIPNSDNATNVGRLFVEHVLFSLATTHSVTSTLTDCTITGNFYGGGSLGKVDGSATSVLDGCKVRGNVFGAGFSASLPTVEVDSIGFRTEPLYYTDFGTYRTGVKGKTTPYTWVEGGSISVDKDKHILYTNLDLSESNLGSVAGNVTLTIKGNSVIGTEGDTTGEKGNVFGGGEQSYVTQSKDSSNQPIANTGNTTVNIEGNTHVLGNVFGGGDKGVVEGSTQVNIKNE